MEMEVEMEVAGATYMVHMVSARIGEVDTSAPGGSALSLRGATFDVKEWCHAGRPEVRWTPLSQRSPPYVPACLHVCAGQLEPTPYHPSSDGARRAFLEAMVPGKGHECILALRVGRLWARWCP